jgi:hypothetical protein
MELHIFTEAEAPPGVRYRLVINEHLELVSNLVFDDWTDALAEAVREWFEEWEG